MIPKNQVLRTDSILSLLSSGEEFLLYWQEIKYASFKGILTGGGISHRKT